MGVSLYLFGAPHIEADGAALAVERRKALAPLAYLAASERAHSRNALAALLWPEWDGPSARTALRRVLVTANKAAGAGALLTEQERIGLAEDGNLRVDVRDFRAALKRSRSHRHGHLHRCDDCLGWLGEATDLYTGDFLAGFGLADAPEFDNWVTFEAESLRRDVAEALEKLAEIHAARREFPQAIPFARRWLALDPLHEPAHRMLIRLYAWAGDQASALRQYRECSDLLQRELGIPPQAETRELCEQVKKGELAALPAVAPQPQPSQTERIVRLPRQLDFVGRRAELAALTELLADPARRLVTIVGMGGMGKSSLAIAAAAQAAEHFLDGAAFVPLAALSQPSAIVFAIADALGYSFPPDNRPPLEQLTGYLARHRLLLVLDNFEHLLEGAEIVAALWEGAPEVTFLVTSRERLNLRAETVFALEGMAAGDAEGEGDGVRLFVQSARRVRFDYTPQAEERAAIGDICRLVGGMPLGIVLAAGWMELLTPAEIASEIQRGLDVLTTDLRDMPERQRNLHSLFEQIWQQLAGQEKEALMRLSVFVGGFTREAAQAVAEAPLSILNRLVGKSLVRRIAQGRYQIHELLRSFAAQKIESDPQRFESVLERHCAWFAAFLRNQAKVLQSDARRQSLDEIGPEFGNCESAWRWAARRRRADYLEQMLESMAIFYEFQGRRVEAEDSFRLAVIELEGVEAALPTVIHLNLEQATSLFKLSDFEQSRRLLDEALERLEHPYLVGKDTRLERARILHAMAGRQVGLDRNRSDEIFREALYLYRAIQNIPGMVGCLGGIAWIARQRGDYGVVYTLLDEALTLSRGWPHSHIRTNVLDLLGFTLLEQGKSARAEECIQESLAIHRRANEPVGMARGLRNLGVVLTLRGHFAEGYEQLEQAYSLYAAEGDQSGVGFTTNWLGFARLHQGAYALAQAHAQQTIQGAANRHRGILANAHLILGSVALVEGDFEEADAQFEQSIAICAEFKQRTEWGTALATAGYLARQRKDFPLAVKYLLQSLRIPDAEAYYPRVVALPLGALLVKEKGNAALTVELHALAVSIPYIANSRWFYDIAGRELEALAAAQPPEVAAAAQARGRALDLFVTAQELVEKFAAEG